MGSTTVITRNCAIAAGCARHDANFRAILCAAGQLPAGCPTLPAGHSGSVAGPVVLPTCRAAGQLPAGCPRSRPVTREALPAPWCCRRAALPVNSRPVAHAPGRSLGKRCRPVVLPVKIGPTLPARGAADVLRCRPVADVLPVVLPAGQLPAGCPRSRPVTREALPAPWCCRRAALPVNSRPVAHAPGRSLGKRCRPVVLPVKIGPTLPARGAADVLRSRPVADVPAFRPRGAAGQLPAGCRAAGYLTVGGSGLRPNRGENWPERHAMACSCARFAGRSEATGGS